MGPKRVTFEKEGVKDQTTWFWLLCPDPIRRACETPITFFITYMGGIIEEEGLVALGTSGNEVPSKGVVARHQPGEGHWLLYDALVPKQGDRNHTLVTGPKAAGVWGEAGQVLARTLQKKGEKKPNSEGRTATVQTHTLHCHTSKHFLPNLHPLPTPTPQPPACLTWSCE